MTQGEKKLLENIMDTFDEYVMIKDVEGIEAVNRTIQLREQFIGDMLELTGFAPGMVKVTIPDAYIPTQKKLF